MSKSYLPKIKTSKGSLSKQTYPSFSNSYELKVYKKAIRKLLRNGKYKSGNHIPMENIFNAMYGAKSNTTNNTSNSNSSSQRSVTSKKNPRRQSPSSSATQSSSRSSMSSNKQEPHGVKRSRSNSKSNNWSSKFKSCKINNGMC